MIDSSLLMQLLGMKGMEWIIIVGLIVAVFFGAKKIPELARSFGRASGEFEKARIEAKKEVEQLRSTSSHSPDRTKLEEVAQSLGLKSSDKSDEELRIDIQSELHKDDKQKSV
jgi:sec-independent protein translocase protein TatA